MVGHIVCGPLQVAHWIEDVLVLRCTGLPLLLGRRRQGLKLRRRDGGDCSPPAAVDLSGDSGFLVKVKSPVLMAVAAAL